jgi:hypothetical protein
MLLVAPTIKYQTVALLVNGELEMNWKEAVVA